MTVNVLLGPGQTWHVDGICDAAADPYCRMGAGMLSGHPDHISTTLDVQVTGSATKLDWKEAVRLATSGLPLS